MFLLPQRLHLALEHFLLGICPICHHLHLRLVSFDDVSVVGVGGFQFAHQLIHPQYLSILVVDYFVHHLDLLHVCLQQVFDAVLGPSHLFDLIVANVQIRLQLLSMLLFRLAAHSLSLLRFLLICQLLLHFLQLRISLIVFPLPDHSLGLNFVGRQAEVSRLRVEFVQLFHLLVDGAMEAAVFLERSGELVAFLLMFLLLRFEEARKIEVVLFILFDFPILLSNHSLKVFDLVTEGDGACGISRFLDF